MDRFKHLIFYDGDCPLCNRAVHFVLSEDQENTFAYAALQGETAKKELSDLFLDHPHLDAIVLLQDYGSNEERMMIEGKAVLRILWLLGGKFALLGWMSFLPSFLFDIAYRVIAKYRYRLFKGKKEFDPSKRKFLP